MKEIKLDCNPKYAIREDDVVISYMYNNPRVMKTYKNKQGADIVDIRVDGKYKSVRIKTLIERYFPNPIPDAFKPIPDYGDRFYANAKGEILSDSAYRNKNHCSCSCELGCSVATISKHIKDKTNYKNYMFDYE